MTLRPKMHPVLVHDSEAEASEKLQAQQQSNKRLVAGVGLFVSIAVTVVALVLAVLASDPLDAKLAERIATATSDDSSDPLSESVLQQQRQYSEQVIDAFLKWFEASGGVRHEHIGIADFSDMGKGIVATEAISEHEQLLFVPMSIVICHETIALAIPTPLQAKFKQLIAQEDELLTAFLLLEMRNKELSQWRSYLQLLPQYHPGQFVSASPLFYQNEAQIDALQDERMASAARVERKFTKRAFKKFQRLFKSLWSNSSGSFNANAGIIDLKLYTHARFLVSSRAFTIKGQRYLVPFGDVFNGKPHESSRAFDNGQRFLQYHTLKDNGVLIRADRAVSVKNAQVFEDYGDNSNYVYFLHHGFLMSDNQFDCASLRLPRLEDDEVNDDVLELKMKVLSHYRVENGPRSCVMHDGRLNQESLELTQFYFTLLQTDAETMRATCGEKINYAHCFRSTAGALLVNNEEDDFMKFMIHVIEAQLKSYATSFSKDLEMLTNGLLDQHELSAVTFRASRKQILHEALEKLQTEAATGEEEQLESALDDKSADSNAAGDDLPLDGATRIDRFEKWIVAQHLSINHLELKFVSDAMGFGTFATKSLQRDEVYLSVPVGEMVMNLQSASKSKSLRRLVRRLRGAHNPQKRMVVDDSLLLVLHLLDEKFGPNRLQSHWKPYLDVLPSIDVIEQSSLLFYDEEAHMELLRASDLYSHTVGYRHRVTQSYRNLVEAMKIGDKSLDWITETRFKYANAILDSRTIWWSGQRHLVPLLDMVNCLDLGSSHAAHRTDLDASTSIEVAITKASWEFAQGEQVVENYAQPNYIYLLFHGFVLETGRNKHDCAHFSLSTRNRDAVDNLPQPRRRVLMEMIENLEIKTWTPELCIDAASELSVGRFAKIAFITESPLLALEAFERDAIKNKVTKAQVQAGLALVVSRLETLEGGLGDQNEGRGDRRRQVIRQYLTQQHEHMTSLQAKLQALMLPPPQA